MMVQRVFLSAMRYGQKEQEDAWLIHGDLSEVGIGTIIWPEIDAINWPLGSQSEYSDLEIARTKMAERQRLPATTLSEINALVSHRLGLQSCQLLGFF